MERLMTAEESYAERRQLFKNIWETAMRIDEKEGEFLNKPKVIKTLRLDEVDRTGGKKKKQKIRNLRTVCNKILEFCDKQDADNLIYDQMAEGHIPSPRKTASPPKKSKIRRKIKKSKSLFSPKREFSAPEQKGRLIESNPEKINRKVPLVKVQVPKVIKHNSTFPKKLQTKGREQGTVRIPVLNFYEDDTVVGNKVAKKNNNGRKKLASSLASPPDSPVTIAYFKPTSIDPPKQALKMHKISI